MSRQTKSPSLAQDLRMLGDVYVTLGWLALQRLRRGRQWPWDSQSGVQGKVMALPRPRDEVLEERETAGAERE